MSSVVRHWLISLSALKQPPSWPLHIHLCNPLPGSKDEPQAWGNLNPQGENFGALECLPSSSRSNSNSEVGCSNRPSSWNQVTFIISLFVSCSAAGDRPGSLGWAPGAGGEVSCFLISFIREAMWDHWLKSLPPTQPLTVIWAGTTYCLCFLICKMGEGGPNYSMQVVGSYGDHQRDKDAEMLSLSSFLTFPGRFCFSFFGLSKVSELEKARQGYI